jgi:hypothetical protein
MWLLRGCTISVLAVVAGIYIPGFNTIFGLVPIGGRGWLKVVVAVIVHLCVVEFGKWCIRRVKPKSTLGTSPFGGGGASTPLVRSPAAPEGESASAGAEGVEKILAVGALTGAGETIA